VITIEPNPDFVVQVDSNIEGRDEPFNIGVAYVNARGPITVSLDALPLKNKILLVPAKE